MHLAGQLQEQKVGAGQRDALGWGGQVAWVAARKCAWKACSPNLVFMPSSDGLGLLCSLTFTS